MSTIKVVSINGKTPQRIEFERKLKSAWALFYIKWTMRFYCTWIGKFFLKRKLRKTLNQWVSQMGDQISGDQDKITK
jgi:hypothetical protein